MEILHDVSEFSGSIWLQLNMNKENLKITESISEIMRTLLSIFQNLKVETLNQKFLASIIIQHVLTGHVTIYRQVVKQSIIQTYRSSLLHVFICCVLAVCTSASICANVSNDTTRLSNLHIIMCAATIIGCSHEM